MNIVVGTDFSQATGSALAAAVALAQRAGAGEVWLVHAVAPGQPAAGLAAKLEQQAAWLTERLGASRVRLQLLYGSPADTVVAFAAQKSADIVLVASRGGSDSPLILLGGTAEQVAQCARFPVLVVRDAGPIEAWARGERALKVVLGVDWSASCEPALQWVRALRKLGPCDVLAAHVYYPEEPERRYGLPSKSVDPDPRATQFLERDLAARVGDLGGQGSVRCVARLALGRAGDHLIELGMAEGADLIVVGTRKTTGLSRLVSISSVVLRFAKVSVACVSATDAHAVSPNGRPRLQQVLVATDLSPFSNLAAPYAYELLCERGGHVHLLHVKQDETPDAELEKELRALVPEFALRAEIETSVEVVKSRDAARAICEAAERRGADVICVASHGRSGVLRAVLGSVAEAVLRQTTRSLFIVRPPKE